jgi:Spy/CpxP family protein refolding chaperone
VIGVRSRSVVLALTLSLLYVSLPAQAQTVERSASTPTAAPQGQEIRPGSASRGHDGDIYGYQLMTERERSEYRDRLRAAATDQELARVRQEHRARMQVRAKERGVSLSGPRTGGGSVQWAVPAVDVRDGR